MGETHNGGSRCLLYNTLYKLQFILCRLQYTVYNLHYTANSEPYRVFSLSVLHTVYRTGLAADNSANRYWQTLDWQTASTVVLDSRHWTGRQQALQQQTAGTGLADNRHCSSRQQALDWQQPTSKLTNKLPYFNQTAAGSHHALPGHRQKQANMWRQHTATPEHASQKQTLFPLCTAIYKVLGTVHYAELGAFIL